MPKFSLAHLFFAISIVVLVGCESAETRAENHYQAAIQYLEEGDTPRAIIEFKNVFKLNGQHKEARLSYARLQRSEGANSEAYSQYLRLVEEHPRNFEGRRALSEMALETFRWKEVERHVTAAAEINPDDLLVRSIKANLDYFTAVNEKRSTAAQAATTRATQLIAADPTLISAHRLIIRDLISRRDWARSLAAIDAALDANPEATDLFPLRLGVLVQLDDKDGVEEHLKAMIDHNPNNPEPIISLVSWYMSINETDKAESFLRKLVTVSDQPHTAQVDLVRFIAETKGPAAAKQELETLIQENPEHHILFKSISYSLDYEMGAQEEAITNLEAVLKDAPASEETDNIKIALAQMLKAQNNPVGSRVLVEEVLSSNPNHLEAIKAKTEWLIKDDDTRTAIVTLRAALGQYPNNAGLLTLMARAHEREGNRDLMSEMLSLAVESSNSAPAESLRYARLLREDGNIRPAESVLLNSLRIYPKNVEILSALTEVYALLEDWGSASEMINLIAKTGAPNAKGLANNLTTRILTAQNREQELLAFLQELSASGEGNKNQVELAIIQSHLRNKKFDLALAHIEGIEASGENLEFWKFVRAKVLVLDGQPDIALALLNELRASGNQQLNLFVEMYKAHLAQGNTDKASTIVDEAIVLYPDSLTFKWYKASILEEQRDFDNAIAIYEDMYKIDSTSIVIANNLASLLTTHRDDEESLNRAYKIARRFKDTDAAPTQDTYGWIAYRLGNFEEAVIPLEAARKGLPDNADIAFHLGMTYAALNRNKEALEQLKSAVALIEGEAAPAYLSKITTEINRLTGMK